MVSTRQSSLLRSLQESGQSGESSGTRVGKRLNLWSSPVEKLQQRELGERTRLAFAKPGNVPNKFQNFQLQEQYDMFDESATQFMDFQFLEGRSKIIQIIASNDLMFALAELGLGFVYSNETNKCICCLNMNADESIGRLFYNKINKSFITVFLYRSEDFPMWRFRSTPIECIRRNQLDGSIPIFGTGLPPSLSEGFDIFSAENNKFLHYRDNDGLRVYDLMDYSLLYLVPCRNLDTIRVSPEILTLISTRTRGDVHLRLLSVEDGKEHRSFDLPLHRCKSLEFIEQFNEKVLFKQEDDYLQILDVRNLELVNIDPINFWEMVNFDSNDIWTPSMCTFLYHIQHFLAHKDNKIEVMNLRGERVTKFEDHEIFYHKLWGSKNYLTSDHEIVISYCRARGGRNEGEDGSINISDIRKGNLLGKICANDPRLKVNPRVRGNIDGSSNQCIIKRALKQVSALYFDEDQNVIYSGNEEGFIHVWSN